MYLGEDIALYPGSNTKSLCTRLGEDSDSLSDSGSAQGRMQESRSVVALNPGRPLGEGRPGIDCLRML